MHEDGKWDKLTCLLSIAEPNLDSGINKSALLFGRRYVSRKSTDNIIIFSQQVSAPWNNSRLKIETKLLKLLKINAIVLSAKRHIYQMIWKRFSCSSGQLSWWKPLTAAQHCTNKISSTPILIDTHLFKSHFSLMIKQVRIFLR